MTREHSSASSATAAAAPLYGFSFEYLKEIKLGLGSQFCTAKRNEKGLAYLVLVAAAKEVEDLKKLLLLDVLWPGAHTEPNGLGVGFQRNPKLRAAGFITGALRCVLP